MMQMQDKERQADTVGTPEVNQPPVPEDDGTLYPVEVDGQVMQLTLTQLIDAARKGLQQANGEVRRDQAADSVPEGETYRSFLHEYPDIRPTDIPPEVWDAANQSGDLLGAYRAYEIKKLREELEEYRKNEQNRRMDIGSARSDGENTTTDPIILALMGKG